MSPQNALDTIRRLSAAVLAVSRHLATDEVLQTIVATARELIGAEYAALGIPDGAGSFAQFLVDGVSDEQWAAIGPLPRQHGLLAKDPERARAELEQVAVLAREAAEELRSVVVELRPAELEEDGLAVTLRKHVEVLDRVNQSAGGPRVRFEGSDVKALSPAAE